MLEKSQILAELKTYACSNAGILADCQSGAGESTASALLDGSSSFSDRRWGCYSCNCDGEESESAEELHVEGWW
jgi:hypothetical protein